jgi:hypothetical protein
MAEHPDRQVRIAEADNVDERSVTIEFFGMPRKRAGRAELTVPAGTLADILAAVERVCPGLAGLRQTDGRLSPHYLLSVDGQPFVADLHQALRPGERLLLLSADAGG